MRACQNSWLTAILDAELPASIRGHFCTRNSEDSEASILLAYEDPSYLQADKAAAGDCQDLRFSAWVIGPEDILYICLAIHILGLKKTYEEPKYWNQQLSSLELGTFKN